MRGSAQRSKINCDMGSGFCHKSEIKDQRSKSAGRFFNAFVNWRKFYLQESSEGEKTSVKVGIENDGKLQIRLGLDFSHLKHCKIVTNE